MIRPIKPSKRKASYPSCERCPASKRFCGEDAEVVLQSTARPAHEQHGSCTSALPATLFRVRSEDLKRMSVVFRDMLTLGENHSEGDVVELQEDAWQLEQLLLLNSSEIDDHPDVFGYNVSELLRLHKPAVKYAMVGIQSLTEGAMR